MYQNFRIKLDFKFYNDVRRRFCWIFIDCTKMLQIDDIKEHIKKLFGINDPFDLFLNENEYLPPKENIQVLKENEIILVSPGSHLSNNQFNNLPLSIEFSPVDANKQQLEGNFAYPEQIEELISPSGKNSTQQKQSSNNFSAVLSNNVLDLSTDTTNNFQKSEEVSDTTTNTEIFDTLPKKKRVRHRKKKTKVDTQLTEEDKPAKPKIANSIISSAISSCKHIRFDNVESNIIVNDDEIICAAPSSRVDAAHKLENLLSLGKNAIPLTFERNRIKSTTCKNEKEEKNNAEDTIVSKNINENIASTERLKEVNKFSDIDFETYKVMAVKPEIKDVIAFKMLKIGTDYTPQMSNFIVAEVISYYPEKSLYKLKILQGMSEVQVPIGKFTIMEETEEHVLNDIITLHLAQIVKPKLVSNSVEAISFPN
ncbi:hypothetical protein WN51_03894 [Melipona quadrifasciata]|uniref:Uncharacterized protein n=1 Tax=Melipona quadrifasciata TaxID=166423 RepID=A0A0N1IT14_9HYME|nr:hypothetical protein WN51_03894 [Melipona quadrifasciata]